MEKKIFEITFTSLRKIRVELASYEEAEFLAEKSKQDDEEVLMIYAKTA